MKRFVWFGWNLLLLWGFFSVSCVRQEYALDDLDLTVNVGGDSLALPLGVTDTIYAGTLLDEAGDEAQSFLKVLADGTLAITQAGDMSMDVPDVEVGGLTFPSFKGETDNTLTFEGASQRAAKSGAGLYLSAPMENDLQIKTALDDLAPEIKRIDYVALADDAKLRFVFEAPELQQYPNLEIVLDISMALPAYVKPSEELEKDGTLHIAKPLVNGRMEYEVPLDGFDFSQCQLVDNRLELTGEMHYTGHLTLFTSDLSQFEAWSGKTLEVKTGYEITQLTPARFEGLFEPELEPTKETVTLDDIPDMLTAEDMVFDFYAPYLLVSVPTNIGLSLQNELTVTPVMQGVPQTDRAAHALLPLPARPDAQMETTKYCLSNRQPTDLAGDYIFVECDLAGLLRNIPDALQIEVSTNVDQATKMVYDFSAHYTAAVNYDFIVPMSFGEDLHLSLGDTIDGLPDLVNEILSKNELHIGGTAWNTMPVDLELIVTALDADGQEVPMETKPQLIKAGTKTGEAVATALDVFLGDRTGASVQRPIQALALHFTLTTGADNVGVPLKKTSWVRAKLKARIPGGITVDLRDLKDEE